MYSYRNDNGYGCGYRKDNAHGCGNDDNSNVSATNGN